MHATIIGAGPIGAYLAWQLSKQHDVTLIEEHDTIGRPIQCTGILTNTIRNYLSQKHLNNVTQAKVKKALIRSPNEEVELPLTTNHIINNEAYCQLLAAKAQDQGATIKTKTRYRTNNNTAATWTNLAKKEDTTKETDYLIGADGPTSTVAKNNNLYSPKRRFLTGIQAVIKAKDYDDRIHFYPSIGAYAWYCPEGDGKARIGVAASKNTKTIFDEFCKKYPGKTLTIQGGTLPLHQPRTSIERRYNDLTVQLLGDAALHIKDTTGGGIVPGTRAASIHAQDPARYTQNLGGLRRELYLHHVIGRAMRNCNGKDWDKIITQLRDEQVKRILGRTSRDQASGIAWQLLATKPALALWARRIIE